MKLAAIMEVYLARAASSRLGSHSGELTSNLARRNLLLSEFVSTFRTDAHIDRYYCNLFEFLKSMTVI